jgi:tRNA-dihydrouridine synthase A
MMDWTDRHCRAFHRTLSKQALLYTEMVNAQAVIHGDRERHLGFSTQEHPIALQLGGAEPELLAEAAQIGADLGYDEINLNCGCPSDRVQSGCFGAVLMTMPELVGDCVAAMIAAQSAPVTVKCRIGVDDQDPQEVLPRFLAAVEGAGVKRVIVHARKAWLKGLSPKENREIPPLDYDLVLRMKVEFPELSIVINGGIDTLGKATSLLDRGIDGVMIGRAAYHQPFDILGDADRLVWGVGEASEVYDAVFRMKEYVETHLRNGGSLHQITRHMLGLFAGRPGARGWRRVLSEEAGRPGADWRVVERALESLLPARVA